jgi:DNA-binding transcriptional MocR family regulator
MQSHIDDILIPTYRTRYRVLLSAIKSYLEPLGVRITTGAPYVVPEDKDVIVPVGGFFTYISFPPALPSADVIAKRAREEHGLIFAYGEMFVVKGDETSVERAIKGFGDGARLCWAWHESEEIEEGVGRLGELLRIMLEEAKAT